MYRITAIVTSILCLVLFAIFLVAPGTYSELYGITGDRGGEFLGRRASAMFLGLAAILWLTRNEPISTVRSAISYGIAFVFAGIAFTGLFEFGRGNANFSIVIAAVGELVIAFVFLLTTRR